MKVQELGRNALALPKGRVTKVKYSAGTQILVSEYDKQEQKIRVVDRVEIPSTEFTFDNAVNKICEMYEYWKPQKIYLDRGYGEYQVETLKKRIDSDIVKGVAFNEKIEVLDPSDRTVDNKMVKHFMVNQTTILLERGQLMFSEKDGIMQKQLLNYRIVKKTSSGKPVYTSENEHALDAFMLTVLCFTIEFPDIAKILEKRRYAKSIGKVNKKLHNNEEEVFNGKFNTLHKEDDDDLKGEPEYVKRMQTLNKVNGFKDGRSKSRGRVKSKRTSWGNRGTRRSRSPGRKSF